MREGTEKLRRKRVNLNLKKAKIGLIVGVSALWGALFCARTPAQAQPAHDGSVVVSGGYIYVLKDNTLYKYTVDDLTLIKKVLLTPASLKRNTSGRSVSPTLRQTGNARPTRQRLVRSKPRNRLARAYRVSESPLPP